VKQGQRKIRKWPFVIIGAVAVAAVAAVLFVPGLLASQGTQASSSVIAYASAADGDVETTVTGSGTLEQTVIDVGVPVGIVIGDVYVHTGDEVAYGDALAAVDSDSLSEAISLVEEELATLSEASDALGGSATIDGTIAAYQSVLTQLNGLYETGYITAPVAGVIGSVNVKKGDTVSLSTGLNGSTDSGSTDSSGSSSFAPASYIIPSASGAASTIKAIEMARPEDENIEDLLDDGLTVSSDNPAEDVSGYQIQSLPFATASVTQAKTACAASASGTQEEATEAYLINLCEAKVWSATEPDVPVSLTVNPGTFLPQKGVYLITFSAADDPAVSATTIVVIEDDGSGGTGLPNDTTVPSDTNGTTGNTGTPSTGSATGSGSGSVSSNGSADEATDDTPIDSVSSVAFQIFSTDTMTIRLQLDELDVAVVKADQQAVVELTALEGQEFAGTVSSVATSDGNYYAVIIIPKTESMYVGFSATATIIKEQVSDVVTIPLAAVQQQGDELFVYTTATEDGVLGGQTTIETGLSDESIVEVTSGLTTGTTVYYRQQITTGTASTGNTSTGGFGGMGGGGMPDFGGGNFSEPAPGGSTMGRQGFNQ
jgi:HlyD family secretion protein